MCRCDFSALGGQKRELQVVVSHLVWFLRTKLRSSVRATSAVASLQLRAILIYHLFFHHKHSSHLCMTCSSIWFPPQSTVYLPPLADVFFVFLFLSASTKFPILKQVIPVLDLISSFISFFVWARLFLLF